MHGWLLSSILLDTLVLASIMTTTTGSGMLYCTTRSVVGYYVQRVYICSVMLRIHTTGALSVQRAIGRSMSITLDVYIPSTSLCTSVVSTSEIQGKYI